MLFGNNANSTAETRVGNVVQYVPYNQTNMSVVTLLSEKTTEGIQRLGALWNTAQRDFLKRLNGVPATNEGEKADDVPVTPEDGGAAAKEPEPVEEERETEKEIDDETTKVDTTTSDADAEQGKAEDQEEEARTTTEVETREETEVKAPAETEKEVEEPETKEEEEEGKEEIDEEKNVTNNELSQITNKTEEVLTPVFDWVMNNSGKGTKSLSTYLHKFFKDEESAKHAQRILLSLVGAVMCLLIFMSTTTMLL